LKNFKDIGLLKEEVGQRILNAYISFAIKDKVATMLSSWNLNSTSSDYFNDLYCGFDTKFAYSADLENGKKDKEISVTVELGSHDSYQKIISDNLGYEFEEFPYPLVEFVMATTVDRPNNGRYSTLYYIPGLDEFLETLIRRLEVKNL